MSLDLSSVGKTFNFETVDGVKYTQLTLISFLDAATVTSAGFDAAAEHQQMYPYAPNTIPTNYKSYLYPKFTDASGATVYLGAPWISTSSIEEVSTTSVTVVITDASSAQIDSLRSYLVANGLDKFTIS